MTHRPEPYLARHIQLIDTWKEAGHTMKVYGIHHDPDPTGPFIGEEVASAVRAAVRTVLENDASTERSSGLGFCIVHVGEQAVWLLVDWWISGGILCQRMLSAPLGQPEAFAPVNVPALACVWELVITGHERDAWVRHVLTAQPDAPAYIDAILPQGRY